MHQLRWATQSDYPFIANSYLKSYRCAPAAKAMINDVYFPEYKARLEAIVATGSVLVACASDDPDQILGYLLFSELAGRTILHYVYVKYPFRQHGIAKSLILTAKPDFGNSHTVITHQPKGWQEVSNKYQLVYNPALVKETK